jgi:GNAT superfamily N-acetyltransferase
VLNDQDFGLLQSSVDAMMERLASLRLNLVVERDFSRLLEFLRRMNSPTQNPTFDPAVNDLRNAGFWLRIVDENGDTVASHAQRIFVTADFHEVLESGRIWYDGGMNLGPGQMPLQVQRSATLISGNVAHAGGLFVHPLYRKKGLSMFLPFLSRALCLRNYDTDFHTALVLASMAGSRIPKSDYGYPHVEWCMRG